MRVGVSLRSGYDTEDGRRGAQWMVERARAARQAGLDSLFVGDQHVTAYAYYQNSPILARLLLSCSEFASRSMTQRPT